MTELADGLPPRNDNVTDARIIVKRGMQGESPDSGWFIIADADVGASEVHRQVTGIAYDRDLKIFHPFVARQSYLDYEWGASGSNVEVVLEIINSVSDEAVGAAIGLALASAFHGAVWMAVGCGLESVVTVWASLGVTRGRLTLPVGGSPGSRVGRVGIAVVVR